MGVWPGYEARVTHRGVWSGYEARFTHMGVWSGYKARVTYIQTRKGERERGWKIRVGMNFKLDLIKTLDLAALIASYPRITRGIFCS